MKENIWDAEFEGHRIRVINTESLFPFKNSDVLEIDGKVIEHIKGSLFQMKSTIFSELIVNGNKIELEVHRAQKTNSFKNGCQIFIDGKQIGGDENIKYPDPKKAEEQLKKGFLRYFISVGILNFGLPFAIIMTILNRKGSFLAIACQFICELIFFGLGMSIFYWHSLKTCAHQKNTYKVNQQR